MAVILIVDDAAANREYLAALLGYGGHRLLQAADGAEGLEFAKAERPDLVIADILMPTMDGYELVRQMRLDPALASTPVIFCTAHYHEREARDMARTCGISNVIVTPAEPEVILTAVAGVLGTPPPARVPNAEEFDRKHLRLLTNKLSQKTDELKATNERLSALIELNLPAWLGARSAATAAGIRNSGAGDPRRAAFHHRNSRRNGLPAAVAVHRVGWMPVRRVKLGSPDPAAGVLENDPLGSRRHAAAVMRTSIRKRWGFPRGIRRSIPGWALPSLRRHASTGTSGSSTRWGWRNSAARMSGSQVILAAQVGRVYQNGSLYADVLAPRGESGAGDGRARNGRKSAGRRARQGSLIGEVGAALTRSDTLQEMLQRCAEALVRAPGCCFRRHLDAERGRETRSSRRTPAPLSMANRFAPFRWARIGAMVQERRPHVSNDVLNDPLDRRQGVGEERGHDGLSRRTADAGRPAGGSAGIFARRPFQSGVCRSYRLGRPRKSRWGFNERTRSARYTSARSTSGCCWIPPRRRSTESICRGRARSPMPRAPDCWDTTTRISSSAATCTR